MLSGIFTYVIDILAGILAGFLLLRFWMQAQRVRPPMGLAQAIFQLTDWLVHPIRRLVPGFRGYDWASLLATFLVALLSIVLDIFLVTRLGIADIAILCLFKVFQWVLYGAMFMLIMEAIFSWVNPNAPFAPFIRALNQPILKPFRSLIPPVGGMDFSPLVAMIAIQVLLRIVTMLCAQYFPLVARLI